MNDLSGLNWSSKPGTGQKSPPLQTQSQAPGAHGNYNAFSQLNVRPTPPVSGRASPANPGQTPPAKTASPANDSFSNLVAFGGSGSSKNLSLQEQQRRLAESKAQQAAQQKTTLQNQWAVGDDVWNSLGSGRSTPALPAATATVQPSSSKAIQDEEDDLFAEFNKPSTSNSRVSQANPQPNRAAGRAHATKTSDNNDDDDDDDDDPFGLSEFQARQTSTNASQGPPPPQNASLNFDNDDDDDILGDLGKPVSEQPKIKPRPESGPEPARMCEPSPDFRVSDHPQDKAVAELVDMGFPADKAKRALEATDTGMNVQAAVGLLLNQAHEEARQKTRGRDSTPAHDLDEGHDPQRPRPTRAAQDIASAASFDKSVNPQDPAKTAQDLGAAFMKSAGAFWKTAQKSVQQAVSEFNSDSESGSSQPRWMQEASGASTKRHREEPAGRRQPFEQQQRQQQHNPDHRSATDEAMMLETERPTPPPRQMPRSRMDRFDSSADTSRDHSPAIPSRLRDGHPPQSSSAREQEYRQQQQRQDPLAGLMRPKPRQPPPGPPGRAALSKTTAEEQASQAYVSSARRRKPATPVPQDQDEGDLLEGSTKPSTRPTQTLPSHTHSTPLKTASVAPIQSRPPPPKRNLPSIPALSLKASHTARQQGNDHFKRGDYSSAHEAYGTSLRHIPAPHTLQLVLLTNRALTALKTGQPKLAIVDADAALTLIGPSKGDNETVDMLDGTAAKPMRDYYGKALMRKAEALENLEKWSEAAVVWRIAVEDGQGGATAIQGRARAEKAAAPKPKTTPRPPPVRSAPPRVVSQKPAAAVNALRAQNQAAEKLDDEKFALADVVDARVNGWKGGKEGNLRALLASLDTVLWDGAGWKKISMADLVLVNKVKIHYMKGIGKCHPDKIPTDATTEQRMIAGAVFATLNEAWDKFKSENNL